MEWNLKKISSYKDWYENTQVLVYWSIDKIILMKHFNIKDYFNQWSVQLMTILKFWYIK